MASPLEAAVVDVVKQGFATSFIGFSVATTIYGISVLQVYLYYRNYPDDSILFKVIVALLFILDTLATIFVAHALYTYFILNFGKSPLDDMTIPWSFSTEKLLVTVITFISQAFYAHAIWRVTASKTETFVIAFLAVVCLALGIVTTVDLFTIPYVVATRNFLIIAGCVQGLAALNDILITVGMCYHIRTNSSYLPSSNQFADTVILYTVSRGILTALTQIIFLVTNVAFPGNTYYQPFHQAVGKFYVNSVFATLNIRQTLQQKTDPHFGTGPGFAFFHEHPDATRQSINQPSVYDERQIEFVEDQLTNDCEVNAQSVDLEKSKVPDKVRN